MYFYLYLYGPEYAAYHQPTDSDADDDAGLYSLLDTNSDADDDAGLYSLLDTGSKILDSSRFKLGGF